MVPRLNPPSIGSTVDALKRNTPDFCVCRLFEKGGFRRGTIVVLKHSQFQNQKNHKINYPNAEDPNLGSKPCEPLCDIYVNQIQ